MTVIPDESTLGGKPAPGALALVQAFINTNELDTGEDLLTDAQGLESWLVDHGLLPAGAGVSQTELERTIELREALRELLIAHCENEAPGDIRRLNALARAARLTVHFDEDGLPQLRSTGRGVNGALGTILGVVYAAAAEGTWDRLKACRNDECSWAFYDASKNHSGAWCTMATCGSQAKSRAYRRRHRAADRQPAVG